MDLSLYKAKLNASSVTESVMNHTATLINDEFTEASTYRKITINDVENECIFKRTDDEKVLKVILRPFQLMAVGDYVKLDGDIYLAKKFIPNEISPNAEVQLCNTILKWKSEEGVLFEHPCVVTGNTFESSEQTGNERIVYISSAELVALVQLNEETKKIKPEQRFVFGEYAYKVISIDSMTNVITKGNESKGYIQIGLESTGLSEGDDVDTGVANKNTDSGWGDW